MLLNNLFISLLVCILSFMLILLLFSLLDGRLIKLSASYKKIIITVIGLTLFSPFFLSFVFDKSIVSVRVFEVFLLQLLLSVFICMMSVFLLKNYLAFIEKQSDEIDRQLNDESHLIINFIKEPGVTIKLIDNELSYIVDCMSTIELRNALNKKSYVNIIKLILLSQDGKSIPLEDLVYALDSLIHPDLCSPEKAVKLFSIMQKYSEKIEEHILLSIKKKVISILVPKFNMLNSNTAQNILEQLVNWKMAVIKRELKSALRGLSVTSQEEYEKHVDSTSYVYFESTNQVYLLKQELAKKKIVDGILSSGDFKQLAASLKFSG